jgi:deoxyribodipyrimidine photo-lyase
MSAAQGDIGIVWFRQDLRLADQQALKVCSETHKQMIPLFIWSPDDDGEWAPGAASRWWLHDSLKSLHQSLGEAGSGLIVRKGDALTELLDILKVSNARVVYWNALYEPAAHKRDEKILQVLKKHGVEVRSFNGSLLSEPSSILNKAGTPYLVYGAYWKRFLAEPIGTPLPAVRKLPPLPASTKFLRSLSLDELALKPKIGWDSGLKETWRAGEDAALKKLSSFCGSNIGDYEASRDVPGCEGTSRLSPHLHFGEISPRQVWAAASKQRGVGATTYCKQLAWREFSFYLLHHHPRIATEPLRLEFEDFPWKGTASQLKAWQQGRTGYPIVDAGMRELWHTGWMHNRVRMIVASFLVKDLRIHWLKGAKWFWDTLVDADLANNTQGWQWTSGCGADASPFFRVFNPVLQGKKFDPSGVYVRRWVPEIAQLPASKIHAPWESGIKLDYPSPIVDHGSARFAALKAYDDIKRTRRGSTK